MSAWYTTEERVKDSLEVAHTPRVSRLIAPKIRAASLSVESTMHRRFYPELRTTKYDYPNFDYSPTWRLWLGDNELITKTDLVVKSGAVTLDNDDILLRRGDNKDEPPYTFLELLQNSSASFGQGDIWQQDITVTGLHGYRNDSEIGGELAAGINSSVTTVDINPVDGRMSVETGSLLLVGSERMITTHRRSLDTTEDITANIDDFANVTTIPVTDGTVFAINEVILINSERMQIIDIAGNNLIVERQYDGTVLEAHTSGDAVYAQRRFTVERGVLGTTAATHSSGDDVSVFLYPGLIEELATAEAIVMLEQATGAYAATRGSGDSARDATGNGLPDLRNRAWEAHARKARVSAI
jgi:hypothetical protein